MSNSLVCVSEYGDLEVWTVVRLNKKQLGWLVELPNAFNGDPAVKVKMPACNPVDLGRQVLGEL